jgi:predicted RNase H-like HicB family nuclease
MTRLSTHAASFAVIFEPNELGGYNAAVPALPTCLSQGHTLAETERNVREAIELHLEAMLERGEEIPTETIRRVSVTVRR